MPLSPRPRLVASQSLPRPPPQRRLPCRREQQRPRRLLPPRRRSMPLAPLIFVNDGHGVHGFVYGSDTESKGTGFYWVLNESAGLLIV